MKIIHRQVKNFLPVFYKITMKFICVFLLFASFSLMVFAKKNTVTSAAEINGKFWVPGDTIVMLNGTWTNQVISFKANGTENQPIVLMAESPGKVILNGSSKLSFSGKYIVVKDLYFKDGNLSGSDVISFRTSSSSLAENCRLTNTTIENYNPSLNTVDSKWVSLYGKNNKVDRCSFFNKTNSGTLLVVWLQSGIIPNHLIDGNYFGYRNSNLDVNGDEINGQEIIRIGDSSTSMQTAGVVVSNNFFERCNGEIEIISNKSCENIYTNNVFYECVGMLTLRHGNRCTVEGNYFFGNGISNTGGVRIIGEDHKVFNNYFENLRGSEYRAALCMVRGKENSALNEYFQVKNAVVTFNTMVNCKQAFSINYNSSSSLNLPPIGSTIAHNHIYNTVASNNNVTIYQINVAAMDVTWKNNLMNSGTYSGFAYKPAEVTTGIDPSMITAGTSINIFEPAQNSALSNYSTGEYPDVLIDIRGRNRGTAKIPGTSQLSGATSRKMPDKATTGADFFLTTRVKKKVILNDITFDLNFSNKEIHTITTESGTFEVFDTSGRCLFQQKISNGSNSFSFTQYGMFIVRFQTEKGNVVARKIWIN